MLVKTSKWAVVAMLALALGFHSMLLQSVAWMGMIVGYSCAAPLPQAVAKTFDGRHPCPLCKLLRAEKKAESTQAAPQPLVKFDLIADRPAVFCFLPSPPPRISRRFFMPGRFEAPPSQPPRLLPG
jgi:hypothetical protein